MSMINQSALATAVINIMGNTQGLEQAIGESKKQMHGFMVFAQAMGGKTGGFMANMLAMGGARPTLTTVLGHNIGGKASDLMERLGVMQNPMKDIDAAIKQAQADHYRNMFRHKMTGAGIQIGGMYNGQRINTPVDLASARARHSLSTPKLADSMHNFVPAAAESAQQMALMFGKLGAVVSMAAPVFKKLLEAGSDLQDKMRRAAMVFGGSAGAAMGGFGWYGANMSKSEFAAGAAGIGSELNQRGVGRRQSASMSSNLAERAGGMAAAWGDDFANVVGKIQSAMGGSDNALSEFGVVLSEDLIRAKAFNSGMIRFGETMSSGVAAQARYELIMEQTSKAIEDSSTSFFSLSNQWRITMSGFSTALQGLGSVLAPVTAGVLGLANSVVKLGLNVANRISRTSGVESLDEIRTRLGLDSGDDDTLGKAKDDAARADEIIRTERSRQSSNVGFHRPEDFYNHVQKSIFGNPTEILKRQTDLLHQFLLVSEEQLKVMEAFGYKVKNGSFLIAN